MPGSHLETYLNDHLAGAVTGVELVTHLEGAHEGTDRERFFADLRADIATDRLELEKILSRMQITESGSRKAAAWLTEKLGQIKLKFDDPASGKLYLLEALETLSLGIEGKRLLWRSLRTAAEDMPGLQGTNYDKMQQRADSRVIQFS